MGDFFSFLRCGPDHHTINLMETGSNAGFPHPFEVRDWAHLQTSCDLSQPQRATSWWGPGRTHRPQVFAYRPGGGPAADHRAVRRASTA